MATALTVNPKDIDIAHSRAPNFIKFGILCTNTRHIPKWFAYFCYILAHLETIAMIFKNADLCIEANGETLSDIPKAFYQILIMSEWVTYDDGASLNFLLTLIMVYLCFLLVFGSFLNFKLKCNCPIPYPCQILWSTVCYTHNLVLFFPIQALLFQTLRQFYKGTLTPQDNTYTLVILCLDLAINIILSTASTKYFQVMLKTKDPLSTKNNFVQSYDIGSKNFVTFMWIFIDDDMEWLKTFLVLVTLFDCVIRDMALFYLLPYYHIKTLEVGAIMQAATTTLAALSVFFEILSLSDARISGYPLETTWVILSPLAMVFFFSSMWAVLTRVLMKSVDELSIFEAVHKRSIFRYLMKTRIEPNQERHKIDLHYYLLRSRVGSLLRFWNMTFTEFLENKQNVQEIVKKLLVGMLKKHPKSELAKVNLAYFYVKYENSFLLANNMIEEVLNHAPSFRARISMSLVRLELQKKLYIEYAHKEGDADGLNMLKFVEVHDRDDELKKHIDEQIKLQMSFWNNFLSHEPDMGTLAEISTKVSSRRKKVAKAWQKLLAVRDKKFSRPLLMYGLYASFVNNEAVMGEKCVEQYQKDVKRFSNITEKDELSDNTLFSDRTIQVSMSGLKTKLGRILDCSSRIDLVFGWKKELIVERPVTMIMPPFFQEKHDGFLLKHYNTGKVRVLNRTIPVPVLASDGYVIPAWMHIKINPLVEMGLSYIATLRPTNVAKTMILLRKDGSIDGMAREFAEDMNLLHRKSHEVLKIFDFCPSFKAINDSFNIMAYKTLIYNNEEDSSPVTVKTNVMDADATFRDPTTPYNRGGVPKTSLVDTIENMERTLGNQMRRKGDATPKRDSMSNVLEIDNEVQSLFEQFTNGSTLSFYPQRSYPVVGNKINLFKESQNEIDPILYNVQIKTAYYGKDFIKIVSIEKVFNEDEKPFDMKIDQEDKYSRHSTSKKTSEPEVGPELEPEANYSFEIEADEKLAKTGNKDMVKKIGFHPTWEQKQKQKHMQASLLTPLGKTRDENTAVHIDESGDFSVLDEIQNYGSSNINLAGKGIDMHKEESSPYNTRTAPNTGRNTGRDPLTGRDLDRTPKMPLLKTFDDVSKTENFLRDRERTELETHVPQLKKLVVTAQKNRFKKVVEEVMHGQESSGHGGTSMKAHHKDPHLEDNLLKRKLKRLAEKMNRGIVDATRENSIASTYLSKGRKVQTMVSKALKMSNNKRSALFFIAFCIAFLVISEIIEVVQVATVYQSIVDIKYKTSVIEKALLRTNSLILLEQNTLMWKCLMRGDLNISRFGGSVEWMSASGNNAIKDLNTLNGNMRQEVGYISRDFQGMFYEKDVRIYERQANDSLLEIAETSNFDAIQPLVEKGLRFVNLDLDVVVNPPISTEDPQFIVDNALNDLLVASEKSVAILVEDLTTKLNNTTRSIIIIYVVYLVLVLVFIAVCINYLLIMRKSAKKFMNLFFRLETQDAEKTKNFLKYFMTSLDSDILDIDLPEEARDRPEDAKSMAKSTKTYRQASLGKQYRHQLILFLKMTPFFTLLIAGSIGYILLLIGIIDQISTKQIQLQSALETQNQQNLLVTEYVEIVLEDSSTTVRNRPIVEDFLDNLDQVQKVADLINKFRTSDQTLEPSHQEIFYGFPCEYFRSLADITQQLIYPSCIALSNGKGSIGLAEINSQLYVGTLQFYEVYLASPKTIESRLEQFYGAASTLIGTINVGQALLEILHEATSIIFDDNVSQIQNESVVLSILTMVLIIVAAIWVWFRMIRKIIAYEAKDREILQIVPIRIILTNRYIRQHLLQDAGGMLDSIKRFL